MVGDRENAVRFRKKTSPRSTASVARTRTSSHWEANVGRRERLLPDTLSPRFCQTRSGRGGRRTSSQSTRIQRRIRHLRSSPSFQQCSKETERLQPEMLRVSNDPGAALVGPSSPTCSRALLTCLKKFIGWVRETRALGDRAQIGPKRPVYTDRIRSLIYQECRNGSCRPRTPSAQLNQRSRWLVVAHSVQISTNPSPRQ